MGLSFENQETGNDTSRFVLPAVRSVERSKNIFPLIVTRLTDCSDYDRKTMIRIRSERADFSSLSPSFAQVYAMKEIADVIQKNRIGIAGDVNLSNQLILESGACVVHVARVSSEIIGYSVLSLLEGRGRKGFVDQFPVVDSRYSVAAVGHALLAAQVRSALNRGISALYGVVPENVDLPYVADVFGFKPIHNLPRVNGSLEGVVQRRQEAAGQPVGCLFLKRALDRALDQGRYASLYPKGGFDVLDDRLVQGAYLNRMSASSGLSPDRS